MSVSDRLPCGHPLSAVVGSGEGTSYCGACVTAPTDREATCAVTLARRFHEVYEELAPTFSYDTRRESAVPWDDVPTDNRHLMIATCTVLLTEFPALAVPAVVAQQAREALTEPLCDATFRARLLRQGLSTDEMVDYVATVEKERREAADALDALAARVSSLTAERDTLREALLAAQTVIDRNIYTRTAHQIDKALAAASGKGDSDG